MGEWVRILELVRKILELVRKIFERFQYFGVAAFHCNSWLCPNLHPKTIHLLLAFVAINTVSVQITACVFRLCIISGRQKYVIICNLFHIL